MRILVVLGHPRPQSLGGALAAALAAAARRAGAEVRELRVSGLDFDPDVHGASPNHQVQEPDIRRARALIAWAEHLVFVYPNWWGTMPARLKGLLDRTLTPGFAFAEREGRFVPLLRGRTATLIATMDMPRWVYRLIFRQPGNNAMARAVLGFCGIHTVTVLNFGPVRNSCAADRTAWIARAEREGRLLAERGPYGLLQRLRGRAIGWLRAVRLQFYPMTWVAYTVGTLAAARGIDPNLGAYWLGFGVLFLLEAAAVFANEVADYETDRRNANFGPFNGGSRVLVEGLLTVRSLTLGGWTAGTGALLAAAAALGAASVPPQAPVAVLTILAVLALGYTLAPLRLVYRGGGELTVGVTHSIGVVLFGYVLQGGRVTDPAPWLLSLPLFLAVLPAIVLAGIPDRDADRSVGKRTVAVMQGPGCSAVLAAGLAVAAAVAAAAVSLVEGPVYGGAWGLVIPLHLLLLLVLLGRYRRTGAPADRIDGLLAAALAYIVWFGVLPLLALAG